MRYRKSCVTGAGVSGSICDGSDNAATTIDSGLSEAAVVPVAVPVTGSAAVATSALATAALATALLATAALPIAVAGGATASSASAVRDGARRSSIGTAAVISMPAEPKPAIEATTQPARTTVPQDTAATVANRRAFMIRRLQSLHLSHAAHQACDGADSSDQNINAQ